MEEPKQAPSHIVVFEPTCLELLNCAQTATRPTYPASQKKSKA
jgi:hypothetical protein